jgi:hypothetical protein
MEVAKPTPLGVGLTNFHSACRSYTLRGKSGVHVNKVNKPVIV